MIAGNPPPHETLNLAPSREKHVTTTDDDKVASPPSPVASSSSSSKVTHFHDNLPRLHRNLQLQANLTMQKVAASAAPNTKIAATGAVVVGRVTSPKAAAKAAKNWDEKSTAVSLKETVKKLKDVAPPSGE